MKLKFKVQPYQTNAVESVVDCFAGQPNVSGITYRIDPGRKAQMSSFEEGFKNADIALPDLQVLSNIKDVQRRQNLPLSDALVSSAGCKINLDTEMETGTGKTYCYIKTMFEMNKQYGWSKFIVMVPSIAIREGVYKSLQITADHFAESYGKKARFFIYNSKRLHELESFSSDAGINVMVINIQAFASRGADNRRIYDELDDFQSRRPIDVIASNRPILILDEPQKMEGKATMEALPKFKPLMILRYSATHKTQHNRIHRLDALDAYNQKLVKKISVRGITVKGLTGTNAYLYLEGIETSPSKPPIARAELEIKQGNGIKRVMRKLGRNDNLFDLSGGLDQYKGFVVSDIDARTNPMGDLARVLPLEHQCGSDDGFPSVGACRAKTGRAPDLHSCHVGDTDHLPSAIEDGRRCQLIKRSDTGVRTHDVGLSGTVDISRASDAVGVFESFDQLDEADPVGGETSRVRVDSVFFDVSADDIDAGHTRNGEELGPNDPVLHGPQIGRLFGVGYQPVTLGCNVDLVRPGRFPRELKRPDEDFP